MRKSEASAGLQARALAKWGLDAQVAKLVEEAVELADAGIKWMQKRAAGTWLIEEIVGVEFVIESIRDAIGQRWEWDLIRAEQEEKLRRHLESESHA